jgi:hypothetical protein
MIPKQDDSRQSGYDVVVGEDIPILVNQTATAHREPTLALAEDGRDC